MAYFDACNDLFALFESLVRLSTALPFALALVPALPPISKSLSQRAILTATTALMAGLFGALLLLFPRIQSEQVITQTFEWIPSLGMSLTFYLDSLALLFSLIVTGVGALVFFYTDSYFDDGADHNRFVVWLLGFAGAMLMVVLSGNLMMTFAAWELTSVTSFMLIGFKGSSDPASRDGAFKALFVTGAGTLALIVGLIMLGVACGQLLYPDESIHFVADVGTILQVEALHQHDWYPIFTTLILLGGLTKSAQFPFHFWLPGAMSAPTPACTYLHSATMVKAGIFLFARLSPVL